jgi:hypothetical protein
LIRRIALHEARRRIEGGAPTTRIAVKPAQTAQSLT